MALEITPDVAHKLKHYVYAYVDPRNDEVFYIGKGVGARATTHLNDKSESKKVERIAKIRAAGYKPQIDIVAHALRDDAEAIRIETALIEIVGVLRYRKDFSIRFIHRNCVEDRVKSVAVVFIP